MMLFVISIQAQGNKNQIIVKQLYETFENNVSAKQLEELAPKIQWYNSKASEAIESRYEITIIDIIQNEWQQVEFDRLDFIEIDESNVLVKGTITGRRAKECEVITTQFQYIWSLKDGKIIKFIE
jgi:hypothetical protein